MQSYFVRVAKSRYFWMHLILSDLRAKYRRSFLGISWSIIHPLGLTLLLGFVMSKVFHSPFASYAPFALSGLIFWEFIVTTSTNGCHAFINAEGYIRQFAQPLVIYSLRVALVCFINLCFANIGLLSWVLISSPHTFGVSWLSLPFSFLLLFCIGWSLATITALITVRFRDFSQMIVLLLQAVWYISPIFLMPEVFKNARISWVVDYNPIYHLLCLFRAPLLYGELPTLWNYVSVLWSVAILAGLAGLFLKTSEKKVIFYL